MLRGMYLKIFSVIPTKEEITNADLLSKIFRKCILYLNALDIIKYATVKSTFPSL